MLLRARLFNLNPTEIEKGLDYLATSIEALLRPHSFKVAGGHRAAGRARGSFMLHRPPPPARVPPSSCRRDCRPHPSATYFKQAPFAPVSELDDQVRTYVALGRFRSDDFEREKSPIRTPARSTERPQNLVCFAMPSFSWEATHL